MKNKYILIIFVLGIMYSIIGIFFKICHLEFGPITGNIALAIGTFIELFAAIIFIIKLLSDKDDNFLNK